MSSLRSLRAIRAVSRVTLPISTPARAVRAIPFTVSRTVAPSFARTFSISSRALSQSAADKELVSRLDNELKHEEEQAGSDPAVPEFLAEFNKDGLWTIEEKSGQDEVFLTRKHGNETIRVTFSISDVENEPVFDEDEQGEDSEEAIGSMFPLRCSISITKPAGGAISIEALAQDGIFSIEHVSFYKDAKLATDLTSEADWKRRATYLGPQFEHLDVTVQEGLEAYLAERGIDESLALFIPDYAEWKEQKEYVSWLKGFKSFISA